MASASSFGEAEGLGKLPLQCQMPRKDPLSNTYISTQVCLGLVYGQMYKLAGKTGHEKKMTGWLLSEEGAVTASLPTISTDGLCLQM